TYNGGLIQKTKSGEIINEITFNRAECLDIYELSKQLNMPVNFIDLDYVYEPLYPVGVESHYTATNRFVPKQNALQFIDVDINELPDPFTINKIVISRPPEELDAIITKIQAHYHEKYNIYKSQHFILEVLSQNVDKSYSMICIIEMIDICIDHILCMGHL